MLLACNPKTEIFVNHVVVGYESFYFFHEFKTEMTILKNHPSTFNEILKNHLTRYFFLSFSHRNFLTREFLLLFS